MSIHIKTNSIFNNKINYLHYSCMDPTLKQKIQLLEQRGQQLQLQAKYKQALDVYQEVLELYKNAYGPQSQQHQKISIKLCQLCNLISMILLQKEKFDLCLMFLKKGEAYCLKMPKYTAVTYNNFACYYRKTGKHRTALMYLQSALQLQWKDKKHETLSDTYLNLCAVLSQLGRHSQALQNVLFSITILQQQLLGKHDVNLQRVPVLSIAYHNMGVQLEYLKRYQQSIAAYEKAVNFAIRHLGEEHGLSQNLLSVLKNANTTKDIAQNKTKKRQPKQKIEKMKSNYGSRPKTSQYGRRQAKQKKGIIQNDM